LHIFIPDATYFVTARIYKRKFLIHTDDRKELVLTTISKTLKIHGYSLHAWAILSNHYHIIIQDIGRKVDLTPLFRRIHSISAITLNRMDGTPGRKVWFQFWDKLVKSERMYRAFMNYVNNNPVKHGMVQDAASYPFCSARLYRGGEDK